MDQQDIDAIEKICIYTYIVVIYQYIHTYIYIYMYNKCIYIYVYIYTHTATNYDAHRSAGWQPVLPSTRPSTHAFSQRIHVHATNLILSIHPPPDI